MKCVYLIYTYVSTMFIFTLQNDLLTIFQPLKRETRFTSFDFQFKNKSSGTVYECSYKQFYSKQMLFFHVVQYEKLSEFHASFSVYKCNEYYVDCVNVISYDVFDLCSKLQVLSHFVIFKNSDETITACPIVGEYYYKNVTIEAEKFGSMFSIPTEKWWEYYWKIKITIYNSQKVELGYANLQLYFIQYRSRNRKPQKNIVVT